MAIKFDEVIKKYVVSYSKRHPITRESVGLRRQAGTKAEASRVYAELIVLVEKKIKQTNAPIWSAFVDQYLQQSNLSSLTKTTIYNREMLLKKYTLEVWGEKFVDEIVTKDIHTVLNDKLASKKESHKKFFLKCVRSIFQYAVEQNIIIKNPTPVLKFKIQDKIKNVLNEEQIQTLLRKSQELDWQWYPHYSAAVFLGLRNGELFSLTWDKVDLEKRTVLVNCSWNRRDGFKSTKSGDDRIVEIPKPLIPLLLELKMRHADGEFVLPRLARWAEGEQAKDLRTFLRSICLPEIRFHDLRASWATLLLSKGVAPSRVMTMGGWKDMDTMMIYMRKAGIDIKGATNCLDDMKIHGVQEANILEFRN